MNDVTSAERCYRAPHSQLLFVIVCASTIVHHDSVGGSRASATGPTEVEGPGAEGEALHQRPAKILKPVKVCFSSALI